MQFQLKTNSNLLNYQRADPLSVNNFYLRDWYTVSLWHLDSPLDPKSGSFQEYSGCKIGFELNVLSPMAPVKVTIGSNLRSMENLSFHNWSILS